MKLVGNARIDIVGLEKQKIIISRINSNTACAYIEYYKEWMAASAPYSSCGKVVA